MKRAILVGVAAVGFLLCSGGVILLISTLSGLNPEDEATALAPIASVSLGAIAGQEMTVMKVVVPDTAEWQRIRRRWGAPEYLLSAVSLGQRDAYCLRDLKIGINVSQNGNPIQTQTSGAAYGYSANCSGGSLRFQAIPGTELHVAIASMGQRQLPQGDLIVLSSWPNTKDKLVGDALDAQVRPIALAAAIIGIVLLAIAVLLWRREVVRPLELRRL